MEDKQVKKRTEELVGIYARQFFDYIAIGDELDTKKNCMVGN